MAESIKELKKFLNPSTNALKRATFDVAVAIILKICLILKIKPNPLSILNIFYALIPLSLIAFGTQKGTIIGAFLLILVVIIDHVDGSIARYHKIKTYMGAYLERMYHRLLPPFIFLALSTHAWIQQQNPLYLYLGAIIIFSMFLAHWARVSKYEIVMAKSKEGIKRVDTHLLKKLDEKNIVHKLYRATIEIPCRIDNLTFLIIILSFLNLIPWMVIIYTPYYAIIALAKSYLEGKSGFKEFDMEEKQELRPEFYDI